MGFHVYVLQSERSGRYYIGATVDIQRRLRDHNAGNTPATRNLRLWRLVYAEEHATLKEARKREVEIKRWKSRVYMEQALGLSS